MDRSCRGESGPHQEITDKCVVLRLSQLTGDRYEVPDSSHRQLLLLLEL